MVTTNGTHTSHWLQDRVSSVGQTLASSFQSVIDTVPGGPHRPQQLARTLNINKDLASRILMVLRTPDPIAVTHTIPGPRPLRKLLEAASAASVPAEVISSAEAAVRDFEHLISNELGDRVALDAAIADWLPDVREKAELLSKQNVFRGIRHLKGVEAETCISAQFVFPSNQDPGYIDIASVSAILGMRRLRPSSTVKVAGYAVGDLPRQLKQETLSGESLGSPESLKTLSLPEFCTHPAANIEVIVSDHGAQILLTDGALGLSGVVDHVFGGVRRRTGEIRKTNNPDPDKPKRKIGNGTAVPIPTRLLIFDLFMHNSILPNTHPSLSIYETSVLGLASVNDDSRQSDLLDTAEVIQQLGAGLNGCRVSEAPKHLDMLQRVCTSQSLDPSQFRAYRCRIEYPICGSQVSMVFHQ